jgi:hypothetical protein
MAKGSSDAGFAARGPGFCAVVNRLCDTALNLAKIMNPKLSEFTAPQCEALLDLLVLATYLDQHLGMAEDVRVAGLLTAMGYATVYDRQRQFDASVNRVRQYTENAQLARNHGLKLAECFTTRDQGQQVYALLEDLITCDGQIATAESQFLAVLRDVFEL